MNILFPLWNAYISVLSHYGCSFTFAAISNGGCGCLKLICTVTACKLFTVPTGFSFLPDIAAYDLLFQGYIISRAPFQTTSNISNQQQVITNSQYQPYYLRPGYRFKTNLVRLQSYIHYRHLFADVLVVRADDYFHPTNNDTYNNYLNICFESSSKFLTNSSIIVAAGVGCCWWSRKAVAQECCKCPASYRLHCQCIKSFRGMFTSNCQLLILCFLMCTIRFLFPM